MPKNTAEFILHPLKLFGTGWFVRFKPCPFLLSLEVNMSRPLCYTVCLCLLALTLAACSPSPVPPTATPSALPPTATPGAAPSASPTASANPLPTSSPQPPTVTPGAAPTAVPTASATQVPTPAPQPTPTPAVFDPANVELALERVVEGLQLPLFLTHANDDSERAFVVEKAGVVRILAAGALLSTPFLDIRDRVGSSGFEQGLLGLAFHPAYPANGRFFVYYTGPQGQSVLSRFQVSGDPNLADPASETVLLTVPQPAANHNGGMIAFGPDGFLYVGLGDGGAANDRFANGQNLGTLLGALLRLEVDAGQPYGVPGDNPFLDVPGARPELWAYGLRNPWRFSFDRANGDLYIADVGQGQYEEVNWQAASSPGGENYGWPILEGTHCFQRDDCSTEGLQLPVAEYDHDQGCSVTGGYVYRGAAYPAFSGAYFYGDYCSGRIWALSRDSEGRWQSTPLLDAGLSISSFGQDEAGELYVLDLNGGAVYRLVDRKQP